MSVTFWKKKETKPAVKKGFFREWGDAILFAVIAATLIRWATFEAYTIPTPSMESSLLVGDYLFVSKLHYGPRTPITPLQVPLTLTLPSLIREDAEPAAAEDGLGGVVLRLRRDDRRGANVVGTPGSGFGSCGEGYLRLSAFGFREKVEEAVGRITKHFA